MLPTGKIGRQEPKKSEVKSNGQLPLKPDIKEIKSLISGFRCCQGIEVWGDQSPEKSKAGVYSPRALLFFCINPRFRPRLRAVSRTF